MNRNALKIIAALTMLVDHLGLSFFNNFWLLRLIGRIAFPIFAFFIAEGWKHTSNRKKYVLNLLICALISQIPYGFLHNFWNLNIIFTFLVAIFCIFMIENYQKHSILYLICLTLIGSLAVFSMFFNFLDYGFFGVLLVIVFYFFKGKLKWILSALTLILMSLMNAILGGFTPFSFVQFFGLVSLLLLMLYNNQKGKANLKWLFYIFYPLHLTIILLIKMSSMNS